MVSELLRTLLPQADRINRICRDHHMDCELSCAVRITDEVPALSFSPEIISALSSLNAAIDIDIILIS